MQYTKLGQRGPIVSTVGFGAWAIGGKNWGPTDDGVSKSALRKALDQGVTLIDTADVYGFGHSEELIADVLRDHGADNVVIATKAGNDFYHASADDDQGYGPIRQTYTKDYIIEALEKSLKRLNVEAVDILQLHSPTSSSATNHGTRLRSSSAMARSNMPHGACSHFRKLRKPAFLMIVMNCSTVFRFVITFWSLRRRKCFFPRPSNTASA